MLITPAQCRRLVHSTTELGGTVPAELNDIIASFDALDAWSPALPPSVQSTITSGEFTAKTAADILDAALTVPAVEPTAVRSVAAQQLVLKFARAVKGDAGDALLIGLRPTFEAACAGIAAAFEAGITADTTADQVLEMGGKTVQAWQDIPKHRRVLDGIHGRIVSVLTSAHEFNVIGEMPWMHPDSARVMQVAFYASHDDADLTQGARYLEPMTATGRAGVWLRLITTTQLQLNTVSRAREIVDNRTAAHAEAQRQQFEASHAS